ncbi:MAG TPA: hypothetical protein VGM65_03450 [Candidatus Udaeobacter sp.]
MSDNHRLTPFRPHAMGMRSVGIAVAAAVAIGLFSTSRASQVERVVVNNTVISRRDPAVEIKLPSSIHYVGTDHFLLSQPKLGNTEDCELYAFVDSADGHSVRGFYWIQFEGYLPGHPQLHMTYDSPQHVMIGGLDFYVDAGVGSAGKTPKPGSDLAHFSSLLSSHGYRRDDTMWVRLVHLLDATKRKELMIIYAESLTPTGYTAAQLNDSGVEHAKWATIATGLTRRAVQNISIKPR